MFQAELLQHSINPLPPEYGSPPPAVHASFETAPVGAAVGELGDWVGATVGDVGNTVGAAVEDIDDWVGATVGAVGVAVGDVGAEVTGQLNSAMYVAWVSRSALVSSCEV